MTAFNLRTTILTAALVAGAHSRVLGQGPGAQTTNPPIDFSGVIFGNYQYRTDSTARAQTGGKNPNQFLVDRVYLTFRMPVGDRASIRATTDIFQNGTLGFDVRLKYGYLQYNVLNNIGGHSGFSALARIGMLHTVVIDHEEGFWPRYVSQTAVERFGFFSSADLGVAAQVVLPNRLGEIYGTITNGPGYASPETDRFKDLAVRLTLTPFSSTGGWLRGLAISPWVYEGSTASKFAAGGAGQTGAVTDGVARDRWGIFAGVRDPRLTLGAHYARRREGFESGLNTLAAPRVVIDSAGDVVSLYAIARPVVWTAGKNTQKLGLIARWDRFKPRREVTGTERLIIAGLQWEPTTRTALALDYQTLSPEGYASGSTPADRRITTASTWFLHWSATF